MLKYSETFYSEKINNVEALKPLHYDISNY